MCSSHIILYQHVLITVAIIITVTYKIKGPNKLLKCISDPLIVTKNAPNFLHRHLVCRVFLRGERFELLLGHRLFQLRIFAVFLAGIVP
jgi:hypothetical protein